MRVEVRKHTETNHCWGEFGPGYDYNVQVTERFVHPESAEEKQEVFDLIQELQPVATKFLDSSKGLINAEKQRLQAKADAKYQKELTDYNDNKRLLGRWATMIERKPEHKTIDGWDVQDYKDRIKDLTQVANYIVNTTTMLTFYTPIDKRLFEGVVSFKDDIGELS